MKCGDSIDWEGKLIKADLCIQNGKVSRLAKQKIISEPKVKLKIETELGIEMPLERSQMQSCPTLDCHSYAKRDTVQMQCFLPKAVLFFFFLFFQGKYFCL